MKEQRRFPRVTIHPYSSRRLEFLNARLTWPNLEVSDVTDLSFKGVATRRPGLFPMNVQASTTVEMSLGAHAPFKTEAKIVWCNLEMVGLEFATLPPEGHLAMTEYLGARLIGSQLRTVESVFLKERQDFSIWLQGPQHTHVFLWPDQTGRLQRAVIELGGETIEIHREMTAEKLSASTRKALLVLAQIDKPDLAIHDFIASLGA